MDAYLKVFKDDTSAIEGFANFENIKKIGKYTQEYILRILGLKAVDPLVVICALYFTHNKQMQTNSPETYQAMSQFFS